MPRYLAERFTAVVFQRLLPLGRRFHSHTCARTGAGAAINTHAHAGAGAAAPGVNDVRDGTGDLVVDPMDMRVAGDFGHVEPPLNQYSVMY